MTPVEPKRILQLYSPEKAAEFAGSTPAQRLAWLDEMHALRVAALRTPR